MVKQILDRGTIANDGTGDSLRDGAQKINDNFTEIYNAIGDGTTLNTYFTLADDSTSTLSNISFGETITVQGASGISTSLSGNTLTIDASGVESGYTIKNASSILNRRTYLKFDGTNVVATDSSGTDETIISLGNNVTINDASQVLTNKTIDANSNTLSNFDVTLTDDSSTSINLNIGDTLNIQGGTGITTSLSSDSSGLNTLTITGSSQAFDTIIVNGSDSTVTSLQSSTSNTLTLVAGYGTNFVVDELNNKITLSVTSPLTYSATSLTGDGSTTTFTIDDNRTADDIIVIVNGLIFTPTEDYSITDTDLIFAEAPAADSEIRIRYLPISGVGGFTYSSESFIGDGSTISFTVSSIPSTTENNVLVTLNGILLFPTVDYTLTGSTLTFTETPTPLSEIQIRYLPS